MDKLKQKRRTALNKQIKSILIALTIVFFIISSLYSQQQQQSRPPKLPDSSQIEHMVEQLTKILSLSAEQKEQVSKLHLKHFKEAKEQMEKNREARENNRKAMEVLRKSFEEQLKTLFNDEQKKEFEKFIKNHHHRSGQQKPGRQ